MSDRRPASNRRLGVVGARARRGQDPPSRRAAAPLPRTALAPAAGEDTLLAWLRRRLEPRAAALLGDDAAMLRLSGEWAVTVDSQIAGTHVPPDLDPAVLARRLLAVNLSDLAAIGAEPGFGFLALSTPPGFDHRRFFRAFAVACRRAGVILGGGDLARAPLAIATLTLLGRRRPGGRFLRRDAGRAGDTLWLGGTVGQSAIGRLLLARGARLDGSRLAPPLALPLSARLATAARAAVRRHLLPRPQLELSAVLTRARRCACLDVSDGLARDLARLAGASGVGATVIAEALPTARDGAALAAALDADPLQLALGGGEDYVLLFALPPGSAPPRGCAPIGTLDSEPGLRLRSEHGERSLAPLGWDHLAGDAVARTAS